MSHADEGWCSLSKGTQSEGLASDTSSDEWKSGSSSEDPLKNATVEKATGERTINDNSGKVTTMDSIGEMSNGLADKKSALSTANTSKGDGDKVFKLKSGDSFETQKSWLDIEASRAKLPTYFRWGVLLSFGFGLWAALCIADVLQSNAFIKKEEGWIAEMAAAKKVTLKAETMKRPAPQLWWFFNLWRYAWSSIMSVSTMEAFMFLSSLTVMIYAENHVRRRWRGPTSGCDQYCKSLLQARTELRETESSSLRLGVFEEEMFPIASEKNCRETWSKFRQDGLNKTSQGTATSMSKLSRKDNLWSKLGQTSSEPRNNKREALNNSTASVSGGRWCWRADSDKSRTKCPLKSNGLSGGVVTNELASGNCNPGIIHESSVSEGKPIDSNGCSKDHKAEKIPTSEKPDTGRYSDRADEVMRTFDLEIEEYLKVENNPATNAFTEIGRDMKRLRRIDCECDEQVKNFILDSVDVNTGIVSSSPAFQKFLLNLRKDRLSCPYL